MKYLMTEEEVCKKLRITRETLRRYGLPHYRFSKHSIRYHPDVVDAVGTIYFVIVHKYIKIGFAKNDLESRLNQIQTGCPYPMYLVGTCRAHHAVEKQMHQKFAHLRVRGEWFYLSKELGEYIAERCGLEASQIPLMPQNPNT